ncbi:MAG TPA: PIG-L deacetylase family protein [Gemmatimonadales bacterium]|nr:PIG-L deacetylase family protein [Gemmatimonadales bacterium]
MQTLNLSTLKRVLCVGAHADDIEIGCGGTLLKLCRDHGGLDVMWVVFSAEGARDREARRSARSFLASGAARRIVVKKFKGSFFPYQGAAIKSEFEKLKRFEPDVIFTHYRDDRHQDHRVLSDLTWNTFRRHLVLEYEVPKYDGDLGCPNFFVPLDEELCRRKVSYICKHFETQAGRQWFDEETFMSLMRLRGIECPAPTRYAEAFYCRKVVAG